MNREPDKRPLVDQDIRAVAHETQIKIVPVVRCRRKEIVASTTLKFDPKLMQLSLEHTQAQSFLKRYLRMGRWELFKSF